MQRSASVVVSFVSAWRPDTATGPDDEPDQADVVTCSCRVQGPRVPGALPGQPPSLVHCCGRERKRWGEDGVRWNAEMKASEPFCHTHTWTSNSGILVNRKPHDISQAWFRTGTN